MQATHERILGVINNTINSFENNQDQKMSAILANFLDMIYKTYYHTVSTKSSIDGILEHIYSNHQDVILDLVYMIHTNIVLEFTGDQIDITTLYKELNESIKQLHKSCVYSDSKNSDILKTVDGKDDNPDIFVSVIIMLRLNIESIRINIKNRTKR